MQDDLFIEAMVEVFRDGGDEEIGMGVGIGLPEPNPIPQDPEPKRGRHRVHIVEIHESGGALA